MRGDPGVLERPLGARVERRVPGERGDVDERPARRGAGLSQDLVFLGIGPEAAPDDQGRRSRVLQGGQQLADARLELGFGLRRDVLADGDDREGGLERELGFQVVSRS
jgi:hypothetical protein